jgi:acyl-CoA thioester hydrolase
MPKSATPFVCRQRIHFDMLDALGMAHNSVYLLLFERSRFDFWRALGCARESATPEWPYVVARHEIDYRQPIIGEMEVEVRIGVVRIGNSSLTLALEIRMDDQTLAAQGQSVLVRLDAQTRRPTPWSDRFRALVQPYMQPSEQPF